MSLTPWRAASQGSRWLSLALVWCSGCLFTEQPIRLGDAPDMPRADMTRPDLDDPAEPDIGEDLPVACPPVACEESCLDPGHRMACVVSKGCVSPQVVACDADQICQEGRCAPREASCEVEGQTRCVPGDPQAMLRCARHDEGGLEWTPASCALGQVCSPSGCVTPDCPLDQRGQPYVCLDEQTARACVWGEGLPMKDGDDVICPSSQRCVEGMPGVTQACQCVDSCVPGAAECLPRANRADQHRRCEQDQQSGCWRWVIGTCQRLDNPSYAWDDLKCHQVGDRKLHMKCWVFDGRCSLDDEPARCR